MNKWKEIELKACAKSILCDWLSDVEERFRGYITDCDDESNLFECEQNYKYSYAISLIEKIISGLCN